MPRLHLIGLLFLWLCWLIPGQARSAAPLDHTTIALPLVVARGPVYTQHTNIAAPFGPGASLTEVTGEIVNTLDQPIYHAHVRVSWFDATNQLITVTDGEAALVEIMPDTEVPFSVATNHPLVTSASRYMVLVTQYDMTSAIHYQALTITSLTYVHHVNTVSLEGTGKNATSDLLIAPIVVARFADHDGRVITVLSQILGGSQPLTLAPGEEFTYRIDLPSAIDAFQTTVIGEGQVANGVASVWISPTRLLTNSKLPKRNGTLTLN